MSALSQIKSPPIVWAIAGSDSGGGAGIQADIAALRAFKVHPCSIITAITAQNSMAITAIEHCSEPMLQAQLQALLYDQSAQAIKTGLFTHAEQVRSFIHFYQAYLSDQPLIVDPVSASTSGTLFCDALTNQIIRDELLPLATVITPNLNELAELTCTDIDSQNTLIEAAQLLMARGAKSVLVKGGHAHWQGHRVIDTFVSQDHIFTLTQPRVSHPHSHGTGCTLASAIAASLAHGQPIEDAVIEANAYIAQGLAHPYQVGSGPGPIAQTQVPVEARYFPILNTITQKKAPLGAFPSLGERPLGVYPIVDKIDLLSKLLAADVTTIQLRVKAEQHTPEQIEYLVKEAINLGRAYNARIFINDHWQLALKHQAYGVHLGQEDLEQADLVALHRAGIRLGISTHSYYELLRAKALQPSYIALGHVFPTPTKVMKSKPQGVYKLTHYRCIASPYPTVAIGGIDLTNLNEVVKTGVSSIAVVRAITQATDPVQQIKVFNHALGC